MSVYAISDLHVGFEANRLAVERLGASGAFRSDWLILAGDIGETYEHLTSTFETLAPRFEKLIWVPGNHELWTVGENGDRGEAKYGRLVELCRDFNVSTPEDDYPIWEEGKDSYRIAPLFLLYDYTFRPDHIPQERAVQWAAEARLVCVDERRLHADPYPSRQAWCHARCDAAEKRLGEIDPQQPIVLVNHFPLRSDLVRLPRIPRFSIWCGTKRTEDWHTRFKVSAVVTGHLHVRATDWIDGVRFEEVSLGYPRHWNGEREVDSYLRKIL